MTWELHDLPGRTAHDISDNKHQGRSWTQTSFTLTQTCLAWAIVCQGEDQQKRQNLVNEAEKLQIKSPNCSQMSLNYRHLWQLLPWFTTCNPAQNWIINHHIVLSKWHPDERRTHEYTCWSRAGESDNHRIDKTLQTQLTSNVLHLFYKLRL